MLWRFSFATTSSIDTLLSRETPPSLEELLDDQDILAEVKAANDKLVGYLSREDSARSLFHWVIAGLDELDNLAADSDFSVFNHIIAFPERYPSFRREDFIDVIKPVESPPLEPGKNNGLGMDDDGLPRTPSGIGLGKGLEGQDTGSDAKRARYSHVATEILIAELWPLTETVMNHKDALLRPFWDAVLPPLENHGPKTIAERIKEAERQRAREMMWTDADEERERKRETIRGMWAKVNNTLLTKRSTEMIRFIQTLPNIIDRMMARIESQAVQDVLARIVQTEEAGVPDVISWLAENRLVDRLVDLLSPTYSPTIHTIAADLLKGIISTSAPVAPEPQNLSKDNSLVRQLTHQSTMARLIGYMLDDLDLTDSSKDNTSTSNISDMFTVNRLPSIASSTSSLCQVCTVLVELVRRNNSDWAEPHLFNTLRTRLMGIQSEHMSDTEEDSRQRMEQAVKNLVDKLAIVHLGNLVSAVVARFDSLHNLLLHPRSLRASSASYPEPLTMERFRIIELYAELLHSSNMSMLNRTSGPVYSDDGALSGGLDGLDELGQALQDAEANEAPEEQVTQARELPVSSGSTDYSLTESDELSDEDEDGFPSSTTTPHHSRPTSSEVEHTAEILTEGSSGDVKANDESGKGVVDTECTDATTGENVTQLKSITTEINAADQTPPPPSQADSDRLRDVMCYEPSTALSDSFSQEEGDVKRSLPSLVETAQGVALLNPVIPLGDKLKQLFLQHNVLRTLLDFFFRYPENNFLQHVVYDIFQQILNGPLTGCNRELVINLFTEAKLVQRVIEAQRINDEAVSKHRPRFAYMAAVSLMSEELIKILERSPPDLASVLYQSFDKAEWQSYVDGAYTQTRTRNAHQLAGGKPPIPGLNATSGSETRSDSESDEEDDRIGFGISGNSGIGAKGPSGELVIGEPLSRTVATEGFTHQFGDENGVERMWDRPRTISGDSDDDDDADWLRPSSQYRSSDDDDFGAFQQPDDDDDAWGGFNSGNADSAENPFSDSRFEPLTPHDWAEAFDREFIENPTFNSSSNSNSASNSTSDETGARAMRTSTGWPGDHGVDDTEEVDIGDHQHHDEDEEQDDDDDDDGFVGRRGNRGVRGGGASSAPAIVMPTFDDSFELACGTPTSNWSFPGGDEEGEGEDLPPTTSPTIPETHQLTAGLSEEPSAALVMDSHRRPPPPPPPPSRSPAQGKSNISATELSPVSPSSMYSVESDTTAMANDVDESPSRARFALTLDAKVEENNKDENEFEDEDEKDVREFGISDGDKHEGYETPDPVTVNEAMTGTASVPVPIPIRTPNTPHPLFYFPRFDDPLDPENEAAFNSITKSTINEEDKSSFSTTVGSAISPPDPALKAALTKREPLGPGVSKDTHVTEDGMLQKEVDGKIVTVPADEVARSVHEATVGK